MGAVKETIFLSPYSKVPFAVKALHDASTLAQVERTLVFYGSVIPKIFWE